MYKRKLNISKTRSFFLFGARATGKTTLLQSIFSEQEAFFVDLLEPNILEKLQAYPNEFVALVQSAIAKKKIIVVDEIQRVPALLDLIHKFIQKDRAIFALTGSSARKLKRGSANLLAGRASVYRLFPLLFTELAEKFELHQALEWGTLPEISSLQNNIERIQFLQAYTDTYLQEEIIAEQLIRKLPPFRRFLNIASQMNTKIINASKIAADINSDATSVKNYFEIIEDTLLGFRLEAYHSSIRKRQRQSPKFYWFDTGVVRSLNKQLGANLNTATSYYGELFETFIINQIRAGLEYQVKQFNLSYLLTKDGAEIDLIVERAGEVTLCIEIKSGLTVRREELVNLQKLSADIDNSKCICLYNGSQRLTYGGLEVIPWQAGLLECGLVESINL